MLSSLVCPGGELLPDLQDAVVEFDDHFARLVVEVDSRLQKVEEEEPSNVAVHVRLGERVALIHDLRERLKGE